MENKKKILLGEKDIMSKDNEDLFLNINLNSTFSELRDNTYTNVFDVEKQFKKERNASRDFRIYGLIDSTVVDSDNLQLYVYSHSGISGLNTFVTSTNSSSLVYNEVNAFGKRRGKYLIELTGYTEDFVFIKILSNNLNFKDQIYSQQLIFRDADGLFVDYGTKTIDIDENGNTFEINNDFYFLYNKHWIKKDLLVIEEKPAKVSLKGLTDVGQITEIPSLSLFTALAEAFFTLDDSATILANNPGIVSSLYPMTVYLDKPSPFGLEKVDLKVEQSTINILASPSNPNIIPGDELVLTNENFDMVFLPSQLSFSAGEQEKKFYVFSPKDSLQEFTEDVTFGLDNFISVETANTLTHKVEVLDATDRNRVTLNFQDIYANRNYFYGQVRESQIGTSLIRSSTPMPAVLRNGLKFNATPMEFYPIDNFNLKIKNTGVDTIFPVNTKLGITSEQQFKSGQSIIFNNISQEYVNTEKHSIKLSFKKKRFNTFVYTGGAAVIPDPLIYGVFYNSSNNIVKINSIPIVTYSRSFKFDYDTILSCFKKEIPYSSASKIGGWDEYNLDVPFDIIDENPSTLTFTIVAKSPGTRLDFSAYGFTGDIYDPNSDIASKTFTATTIQAFKLSAQTPLEIILGANSIDNLTASYEMEFSKKGFDTMRFTNTPLPAAIVPPKYFLASGTNTILRNWNDSTNQAVYAHTGVVDTKVNYIIFPGSAFGQYKTGEVYTNGLIFLANLYLDNTNNNYQYTNGGSSLNVSHAINAAGNFSHDFLPAPIAVIPETASYFSVSNVTQMGYLRILRPNFGVSVSPPSNIYPHRSFDFRTGSTGNYNTYFTDNYTSDGAWFITGSFGAGFKSSGGTISTTNSTSYNTLKTYFETGKPTPLITDQGINAYATAYGPNPAADYAEALSLDSGNNPTANVNGQASISFIKLESKTAGVPFYINNVVEMRYIYGLADYTKNSINYYESRPNQIAGVTINLANNHMGGYSLTRPVVPILPTLLYVSFEQPFYSVGGIQQVKISLDSNSINGNESVTVNVGGNAISGVHYIESQTMPTVINWGIGEKDKFITFQNIAPPSVFSKNLVLTFSNLINLNLGTNASTNLILF
jgi:hypothetical protein